MVTFCMTTALNTCLIVSKVYSYTLPACALVPFHNLTVKKLSKNSEIGWKTLQTRRKWHKLIHMYKIVNQLVPDYLHSHCPDLLSRTSAYNTRQSNSLRFPICRTSAFKNSFFPSTARYLNGVDIHTRNSKSISIFDNKVKSMFQTSNAPKFYYTSIDRKI